MIQHIKSVVGPIHPKVKAGSLAALLASLVIPSLEKVQTTVHLTSLESTLVVTAIAFLGGWAKKAA